MTRARPPRDPGDDSPKGPPREITMTDLEQAERKSAASDPHAAGTPGGGTASGGLAGSNKGAGEPDEGELEAALGSGLHDNDGDTQDAEEPGYGGPGGGAVGGTPAGRRDRGGHTGRGLRPQAGRHEGTLGLDPLSDKEDRR